jgi:hypothetical protein
MQLTYRGNSYKNFERIASNSDSTYRLPIKLIYRGQNYYYNPRSEEVNTGGPNVTLIYRGSTYERHIPMPKPARTPVAIKWFW